MESMTMPAEPQPAKQPKPEPARSQSRVRLYMRFNAIAQVFLLLAALVGINVLVYLYWYPERLDLTKSDYYKLSDKTKTLLQSLKKPVDIIVFFQPHNQDGDASMIFPQIERLLSQYKYIQPEFLRIEYVDPDRDLVRTSQLAEKYQVAEANVVVFASGDRNKYVSGKDLIDMEKSNPFAEPRVSGFKGEQQFTAAIQNVVEGKPMKAYFIQGHAERDPDDYEKKGASTLAQYLRRDNLLVERISLLDKPEIPADCDLLVIDGPTQPYQPFEIKLLEDFFKRQGRALIMLDPETTTGLEDLLKQYGVLVGNNLIMSKVDLLGQEMYNSTAFGTSFGQHPIVEKLEGKTLSFHFARTVDALEDKTLGYQVTELAKTPEGFWAETALAKKTRYEFNPDTGDKAGPVSLAVAVQPKTVGNVDTEGTRIVVTGTSTFLENDKINAANMDFFLNCVNWLLKRPQLIGIGAKRPQEFILGLNARQLLTIGIVSVGVMPFTAAVLGFAVWFRRRK